MKRLVLATLALVAVLAATAPASQAADECKGLQVCIPVKGPWVAVPPPGGLATTTSWMLKCPQGVVGGVDARASEKAVTIEFPGRLGSPVRREAHAGAADGIDVAFTDLQMVLHHFFLPLVPSTGAVVGRAHADRASRSAGARRTGTFAGRRRR